MFFLISALIVYSITNLKMTDERFVKKLEIIFGTYPDQFNPDH